MEWKNYPENKPEKDSVVLCINDNYSMTEFRALYHADYDTFTWINWNVRETVPLSVTRYIEIPSPYGQEDNAYRSPS